MFGYCGSFEKYRKEEKFKPPIFSPFRNNHCPCFGGTSSPGVLSLGSWVKNGVSSLVSLTYN